MVESTTVCCRNVQLMPTLFLKLTKIWQRENGKFVDFPSRILHEIATQGHSRSFILQSFTHQQGALAYRHIILLALSLKFLKK